MLRMYSVFAVVSAALLATNAGFAQDESPSIQPVGPETETQRPEATPASVGADLTRADLEAWVSGFMPYALQRGDIAGAVVVVVNDGEVLFQEGYGYADVEERTPVDPQTTLFRIGSVSKLFTWTAVMQLVEEGKLDLDTDVNTWLDFEIPPHDGGPVTLRDIMTHTPGFEENVKELMSVDPEGVEPLGEALADWVPERIFAAGSTPAYSNYATALAGYIVERVSGQSFDDYVEQHIFEPLGMEYSTFRQPLPERLEPYMSKGYRLGSGEPQPYEMVALAPAGSVAASGADMARFMIAHLQDGAFNGAQILEPETARRMHTTAADGIPPLNTMMLGFYGADINGRDVIAHGGDTQWFHSDLHLFLEEGAGLFISMNSAGRMGASGAIRGALFQQFSDRYFSGPTRDGEVSPETAAEHAALIAGRYRNSRRSESNFIAILNLFGQFEVVAKTDGTILTPSLLDLGGQPRRWREIAPFVWRDTGSEAMLAAEVEDNEVVRFSAGFFAPFMVFEPVPWWQSSAWLVPALLAGVVVLLLSALLWPVRAIVRRRFGARLVLDARELRAYRLVRACAAAVIVVLLGWAVTMNYVLTDFSRLSPELDPWFWVLQIVGLIVFVGAAAISLWNMWVAWSGKRSWYAKLWSPLLAASCLAVLWIAFVFQLIGMTVNY